MSGGLASGCAQTSQAEPDTMDEAQPANDPLEPMNRAIFEVNRFLDTLFLEPAAIFYKDILPPVVQTGIHNFLNNLRSPVIFVNDVLQGRPERAGTTAARFAINSTIGVAGLGDPASDFGFAFHDEDFGQTLAVWGVEDGPFLMLPVFGPSNPRDTVGLVADFFLDPVNWWAQNTDREWVIWSRTIASGIDTRARRYDAIEDLERTSIDFYAAVRSVYRQRRADEIRNGDGSANVPAPGLSQGTEPDRRAEAGRAK